MAGAGVTVPRQAFLAELRRTCEGLVELTGEQEEQLYLHYALLVRWNPVAGLTAVGRLDEAVQRHYGESLFLAKLLPKGSLRILDLGSGGGFPGFPIAVYRPECEVWLCERRLKKLAFLKEATRGRKNVVVIADPAEAAGRSFDWLVSRAVRAEEVLAIAERWACCVGLLVGGDWARQARRYRGFEVSGEYRLPWGKQRVALIGRILDGALSA